MSWRDLKVAKCSQPRSVVVLQFKLIVILSSISLQELRASASESVYVVMNVVDMMHILPNDLLPRTILRNRYLREASINLIGRSSKHVTLV
jgi:hypothetical protein